MARKLGDYLRVSDPDARGTGLFTQSQREFIYDPQSKSEQSHGTLRQRIRDRVRNALIDFEYVHAMKLEDQRMVFSKFDSDDQRRRAIVNTLRFLYTGIQQTENLSTEALLEDAIRVQQELVSEDGWIRVLSDVTVTIDKEYSRSVDAEELLERLERGEPVTNEQLGALLREVDGKEEILDIVYASKEAELSDEH